MRTTPQNYHGLNYQKGKFNGNHKKKTGPREGQEKDRVFALGKVRKKIESLLLKTRSLECMTWSLVHKMIKIQIEAEKGILEEYSFKDQSLPGKDQVLAFCNNFSKNYEFLTRHTYNKTQSLKDKNRSIWVKML